MPKSTSLEAKLELIAAFRSQPHSDDVAQALKKYLGAKNNFLVAKATRVVGECGYDALIPDLLEAFERFLQSAEKTDKSCMAKTAIIKTLRDMQYAETDIFLKGIRYFQFEPSFGGKVDSAAEIRSISAFALVEIGYPDVLYELIRLAADPVVQVRIAAARAMANTGTHEAELLLRLLATCGDRDLTVISECLSGLMHLAPTPSFDFVAGFIESPREPLRQAAALALAETHSIEAFEFLQAYWHAHPDGRTRRMLVIPIAILKRPEAIDFLLSVIENGDNQIVLDTLKALKIYQHDVDFTKRLRELMLMKNDRSLADYFQRNFG